MSALSFLGMVFVVAGFSYFLLSARRKYQQSHQALSRITMALENEKEKNHFLEEKLLALENQLEKTLRDPITKLPSWSLFEDRVKMTLKESERYKLILGILFINLDDFKLINEVLGHEMGNAILVEVANRLQACIRKVDSVSRLAKDQFVVLLTKLAGSNSATSVALRILQALSEPYQIQEQEIFLTSCIGIAIYPEMGNQAEILLNHAESALNQAKEKGKNTYQFYQESNQIKNQYEIIFYKQLSNQTIYKELKIHYLPIVDIDEEKIIGMETVLHWQPEGLDAISSNQIFAMANRQGRLNHITEWVIKTACAQFKHWHEIGFDPQAIVIPVSVRQIENAAFVFNFSQILKSMRFESACLILKISEWPPHIQSELLEKAFHMLDYLKIKTMVAHFGSNAFSLQDLKNFPVNYLKLDASFIKNILNNEEDQTWVKTIISMANHLPVQFIAPEVENEDQKVLLKNLGCHLMQGKSLVEMEKSMPGLGWPTMEWIDE